MVGEIGLGGGQCALGKKEVISSLVKLFIDQLTAGIHTVVADVCTCSGRDQKLYLPFVSSAERTAAQFNFVPGSGIVILSHE